MFFKKYVCWTILIFFIERDSVSFPTFMKFYYWVGYYSLKIFHAISNLKAQCDFFMVHRHYKIFVRTSLEKLLYTSDFVNGPSRSGHLQFTLERIGWQCQKFCLILQCRAIYEVLIVFWQNLTTLLNIILIILISNLEIEKWKKLKIGKPYSEGNKEGFLKAKKNNCISVFVWLNSKSS